MVVAMQCLAGQPADLVQRFRGANAASYPIG
jgi:hypothetical protein